MSELLLQVMVCPDFEFMSRRYDHSESLVFTFSLTRNDSNRNQFISPARDSPRLSEAPEPRS